MTITADTVRFLHTSDWQLGMTRHFLAGEAGPRFALDRIDAIARLGALAADHRAAFIVVAGDVFESNQVTRQTVLRALEALEALPVPVFLLPGNHDPLDATSIFSTREFSAAGTHVQMIRDSTPIPVPGLAGLEVVGAPWRTRHPNADLCAAMLATLAPAQGTLRVAVCHGQTDTLSPDLSRPEIIRLATAERALADGRIHYLALGDRHSVTRVGNTGRIWYSGAPVATDFTEDDPNKTLLVALNAAGGCEVTPLPVGNWRFMAEHFDLNGPKDLKRIADWLHAVPDKARAVVKLGFTGSINLATAAALEQLLEAQAPLFASLRRRERTTQLAVLPDALDEDSVALSGYARAAWDELLAAPADDQAAQHALQLLYRLSQQGGMA